MSVKFIPAKMQKLSKTYRKFLIREARKRLNEKNCKCLPINNVDTDNLQSR
jgi:hypothetical protein